MMKFVQKLGKALMLPVACLPLCGLLMGVGYLLCPASMQGGEVTGAGPLIGLFLVKAGGALVDNMALLFAVGVGVGMAKDQDGVGGIAALTSWFMITTLLSLDFVVKLTPSVAGDPNRALAFAKIANPFVGILSGIIGALCYNRFKDTKLPDWLAFFSGKRCVAIVAGLVSILVSAVMLFIWPMLYKALISLGQSIAGMGAVGAGIYAFLNRLLIPFGLHHALNNVFWFDTIGLGDLKHFWAGETSADVTWSLGMYMSGFFPCMMFGVPGAALAILQCARSENKKVVAGILTSAAICSFVCGITEPFEFAFMFAAPALYAVYAVLYGIFTVVVTYLNFRAGFAFSAGATDLLFSASLPAAQNTWLIVPLGIAAFVIFFAVFRFMIVKFDLKTPGREDEDDATENSEESAANRAFVEIAAVVLEGVGGKDNVVSIDNCITRLRLEIRDSSLIDEKKIKSSGARGVIRPAAGNVQVVIGQNVQFVADEFKKLCE
ncbi:MAG: PTS transporter subunit EIIC [Schwartzia sp.]|nr:PTS transporter subunit EIIC [Schwartzia sp. (in: firmicutes)]